MDDEMTMIPTGDPITDRAHALVALAAAVENTSEPVALKILIEYMQKINRTIQVPTEEEQKKQEDILAYDNVTTFPGGH